MCEDVTVVKQQLGAEIKKKVVEAYHTRDDYPLALSSWDDRRIYRAFVFKIVDEVCNGA